MSETPHLENHADDIVVMARIAAPFGIKGWVKLQTFTDTEDSLDRYATWLVKRPGKQDWEEFELEDFAVNVKGVIAKFKGYEDRTAVELLKKSEIGIPRDALDVAKEGEYFWIDLMGADVVNVQGEALGKVETLMETGANDVLVVKAIEVDNITERLIPFIADVIVGVDRKAKRITVDWQLDY